MAATADGASRRRAITVGPTTRTVLTVAAIAGLIYVCWLLRDVLLLACLAVFLAVALSAPVNFLQDRLRMPRAAAILVVYVLLAAAMVLVGLLILPPLIQEFTAFLRAAPGYVRQLQDSGLIEHWDDEYGIVSELEGQAKHLPSIVGGALSELETVTVTAIERIVELIAILAIAFLLLLDAPRLLGFVYREVAPDEEAARRIARETSSAVGGYVAGVFAVAALAGIVSFVVMTILGIPYAVPLAVQMAFFAILPLVGSTIGAFVIAIVAAFQGVEIVVIWGVFWILYQQTETHVLGPLVYRKAVDMSPALVILSVMAGATLLGVLGALLAIPAAATIQILIREWWRGRKPVEPAPAAPAPKPVPG
ncbi:MAG TPA: AI-2E family transporter [Thermoleophilaceae bacterium]|nr:AI-2E family transporter [Thermoleophilaceae bacterium]